MSDERTEACDGFKVLGQHRDGCYAERDPEGITFIVHDGEDFRRDKIGRRNARGSCMWHRFKCNDTRCTAILLVRWDVLARFVNRASDMTERDA